MEDFKVGRFYHKFPTESGGRAEVIKLLCFGPATVWVVGIEKGKYFREYYEVEDDDTYRYEIISKDEFIELLDEEILLCMANNRKEQAEALRKYRI